MNALVFTAHYWIKTCDSVRLYYSWYELSHLSYFYAFLCLPSGINTNKKYYKETFFLLSLSKKPTGNTDLPIAIFINFFVLKIYFRLFVGSPTNLYPFVRQFKHCETPRVVCYPIYYCWTVTTEQSHSNNQISGKWSNDFECANWDFKYGVYTQKISLSGWMLSFGRLFQNNHMFKESI